MPSHKVLLILLWITFIQLAAATVCPDNVSTCSELNTCCLMKDESHYGCCPQHNAVCCSDHIHCCPSGLTCDEEHSRCISKYKGGSSSIMWVLALLGRTETPLMALRQAGETLEQPRLEHASVLWPKQPVKVALQAALVNNTHLMMVPCPDDSVCPEDYTCCPFSNGSYGCCPYSQGVCCPDHLSCCPNATACTADGECIPN